MEKINNSDDEFYDEVPIVKKKKLNIIEMCDDMEKKLTESFKAHRDELRKIKREYQKKMNKLDRRANNGKKLVGINNVTRIPDSLADLIGVKRGTEMARTELGKRVHNIFKSRDLLYEHNKRIMRVDDELAKIFGTTTDVNKSVNEKADIDIGINFYNLQSYIKRCYEKNDQKPKTRKKDQ